MIALIVLAILRATLKRETYTEISWSLRNIQIKWTLSGREFYSASTAPRERSGDFCIQIFVMRENCVSNLRHFGVHSSSLSTAVTRTPPIESNSAEFRADEYFIHCDHITGRLSDEQRLKNSNNVGARSLTRCRSLASQQNQTSITYSINS